MGAACCVAAKNKTTVIRGSPVTAVQRHSHHSPSWSFRWDNRGRVVGEETTMDWLRSEVCDDRMDVKSTSTVQGKFTSNESSPLESFRSVAMLKSPAERNGKGLMFLSADPVALRYLGKVKESFESSSASCSSPSVPGVSSITGSPSSTSQGNLLVVNAAHSRGHHPSPARSFVRHVSDNRIIIDQSPTSSKSGEHSSLERSNESNGGTPEICRIPGFSEPLRSIARERCSFDRETSSLGHEKRCRNSKHKHGSSFDLQTCGICSKLLTERSSWILTTQKLLPSNEISVVSVLTCGHVYHGECLEHITPDISKYDPSCPLCTFGARKTVKMCEKALRDDLESIARSRYKRSVSISSNIPPYARKTSATDDKRASNTTSGLTVNPLFRRHLSLGSGTSGSMPENQSTRRKSFFWAKSSK